MTISTDTDRILARAREIADREGARLLERTPGSAALYERASRVLPNGVSSNFQANDPYPVYLARGLGSKVWDVDGTEYRDFHSGFGVNVVGHGHPKIVEAVRKAAAEGAHFAVTTETTVALAEESLRSERKAYEAAVGTSLDVIDAQLSLSRAEVDRLTALLELNLAVAQLLEASGQSDRFAEYLDRATPAEDLR